MFNTTTSGITVDLNVAGDPNSPYYSVGSLAVNVDTNTATNTSFSITNSPANFGDTATLQATVAADLAGIGPPTGTVEFYEQMGSETIDLGAGTLNAGVATLTTPRLVNGSYTFTAVYSGDDTFVQSTSAAAAATISDNPADTAAFTDDWEADEGETYVFSPPACVDGQSIAEWVVNWGDGSPYLDVPGNTVVTHAFGAPGSFTITAVGIAGSNFYLGTESVWVWSAAPSAVSVSADNCAIQRGRHGGRRQRSPDQLHVSFTGPASQESYTVTINWGGADADDDGTTTFSLNPGQTSFVYPLPQYAVAGTYPITLTVTDAESNYAASSAFYVTYTNSAPSALVLSLDQSTVTAGSGEPNLSGSFTDPQFNIAHVVTIDWGDETAGSPADTTTIDLDPGETTFQAEPNSTTYAAAGTYPISVTVTGMDGTTGATTSVTVTPVPAEVMVGATTPEASEYLGLSYAASDGGSL